MTKADIDFPRRAPTQLWMMLTFGLFVGIAVLVVGIYGFVVLRNQLRTEAYQRLEDETRNVVGELERVGFGPGMQESAARISRLTAARLVIWHNGKRVADFEKGQPISGMSTAGTAAYNDALVYGLGFEDVADGSSGTRFLYAAIESESLNLVVGLGRENVQVFAALRRTQLTLAVGMGLALMLSLLGSWIASKKVSGPLRALTQSAERINAGRLEEGIRVHSRASEIQDLARSLDAMAEHFSVDIKQLQRLVRIQNEFLGDVSHEVRNPIFAIGGYLEALASRGLTDDQRERYVQKGIANLDRLNNLFSDLVEIARLEYRGDLIQREIFDIQALIEEVADTARMRAEEKSLRLDVANPSSFVEADRNRIAQVLTNLIENAIAYTDSGAIRCTLVRIDDRVRIEVEDTGRGIGPDHIERIFDRFYRVDTARSRKHGGTGLGLSIVRQILHAHGTSIHVRSAPGVGSLFWFELPHRAAQIQRAPAREGERAA